MKATLILVGKTVDKRFAELISEYTNRLKHYISFEISTIPELKNTKSLTSEQQKSSEAELIIKNLQPSDYVVLLDEHGKEMRSVGNG